MGRSDLVARLTSEAEEQYRIFNQKFVVTNSNPMLGVKVPRMRAIAREISQGDWRTFLQEYGFYVGEIKESCSSAYFEEIMIIGMVINLAAVEPDERLQLAGQFVPLIDNWGVCDVFCGGAKWVGEPGKGPKARLRVPRERVWKWLQGYLLGDTERNLWGREEFEIRFAVVMMMSYFLTDDWLPRVFEALGKVHFGAYYVDMGVAWCLATARAKFDQQTQEFVAQAGLPAGVIKKYEQKVRDSLRIRK